MGRNRKSLPGAKPKGIKQSCADRANEQLQNNQSADNSQTFGLETYERAVRRACIDAYILLKDFPSRLWFSYYIDRNGRLRCQAERRAGT